MTDVTNGNNYLLCPCFSVVDVVRWCPPMMTVRSLSTRRRRRPHGKVHARALIIDNNFDDNNISEDVIVPVRRRPAVMISPSSVRRHIVSRYVQFLFPFDLLFRLILILLLLFFFFFFLPNVEFDSSRRSIR